jgi:hypothetical protein
MLEAMQRVLGLDDATAKTIINVLAIKYATEPAPGCGGTRPDGEHPPLIQRPAHAT